MWASRIIVLQISSPTLHDLGYQDASQDAKLSWYLGMEFTSLALQ